MELAVLFGVCLLISGVAIRLSAVFASRLGIMDRPGGHKQHQTSTPFVGGFGVLAVLLSVPLLDNWLFVDFSWSSLSGPSGLLVGAVIIFLTGLADDIWCLGFKPRLIIQALAALSMVLIGGVELRSLGEILPGGAVDLGWLAIPMAIFSTIGLINALNMIDGIDGLSGSVSLVSLALVAMLAHSADSAGYVFFIVALMGGIGGFLYYNLRYPGNHRARVFLGDNGSMLLGFLFAWLFIVLSQGGEDQEAVMTPVTALWLFAWPLMDTVGVMIRRIWQGKSPFRPDRHHLHHLFVCADYRVCDVVALAVTIQLLFGLIGIGGLLFGVPEYLMFGLFIGVCGVYFLAILRPGRIVPWLRSINGWLGLPSVKVRGIFIGYLRKEKCREVLSVISEGLGSDYDYHVSVHQMAASSSQERRVYCVVHIPTEGNDQLIGRIQRDALRIKKRLAKQRGIEVRLFLSRNTENDVHSAYIAMTGGGSRRADRRCAQGTLIYSKEHGQRMIRSEGAGFEFSLPPGSG